MGVQVTKIISANAVKTGTVIVQGTAKFPLDQDVVGSAILNSPSITDIQSKYDARFDEVRYYSGDTAS